MNDYSGIMDVLAFGPEREKRDSKNLECLLTRIDARFGSFYCKFSRNYKENSEEIYAYIGHEFGSYEITKEMFLASLVEACKEYIKENPSARINVELKLVENGLQICKRPK